MISVANDNQEKINKLKQEGFAHVYEWTDEPNTEYPEHSHKGKVSFYVTKGNILMNIDGTHTMVRAEERMDVPVGIPHTAKVGPYGCTFIVGEEIKGDS
jgi:quercetin dioxygenase-like cupin family protein